MVKFSDYSISPEFVLFNQILAILKIICVTNVSRDGMMYTKTGKKDIKTVWLLSLRKAGFICRDGII